MSLMTVDELQSRIAAVSDQDQNTANLSSADYALRLKYLNMAQEEWAELYDWQALYKEYNTRTSLASGNITVTLPLNFRKIASFPVVVADGVNTQSFPEVRPQENKLYQNTNRRINIIGNYFDGYSMVILGTPVVSGASIMVPYYSSPQSLVSPIHIATCPNPQFLVKRSIAYIMESRGDARFTQFKIEAENILRNLLEQENVFSEASTFDRVKTYEETRYDFRMGRD